MAFSCCSTSSRRAHLLLQLPLGCIANHLVAAIFGLDPEPLPVAVRSKIQIWSAARYPPWQSKVSRKAHCCLLLRYPNLSPPETAATIRLHRVKVHSRSAYVQPLRTLRAFGHGILIDVLSSPAKWRRERILRSCDSPLKRGVPNKETGGRSAPNTNAVRVA